MFFHNDMCYVVIINGSVNNLNNKDLKHARMEINIYADGSIPRHISRLSADQATMDINYSHSIVLTPPWVVSAVIRSSGFSAQFHQCLMRITFES